MADKRKVGTKTEARTLAGGKSVACIRRIRKWRGVKPLDATTSPPSGPDVTGRPPNVVREATRKTGQACLGAPIPAAKFIEVCLNFWDVNRRRPCLGLASTGTVVERAAGARASPSSRRWINSPLFRASARATQDPSALVFRARRRFHLPSPRRQAPSVAETGGGFGRWSARQSAPGRCTIPDSIRARQAWPCNVRVTGASPPLCSGSRSALSCRTALFE